MRPSRWAGNPSITADACEGGEGGGRNKLHTTAGKTGVHTVRMHVAEMADGLRTYGGVHRHPPTTPTPHRAHFPHSFVWGVRDPTTVLPGLPRRLCHVRSPYLGYTSTPNAPSERAHCREGQERAAGRLKLEPTQMSGEGRRRTRRRSS